MTTHRSRSEDPRTSRPRRRTDRADLGRVIVAYEDGEVMDDLDAFERDVAALDTLDTLLVRLMQERIDTEGDDRCDLAAFTF